MLVGKDGQGVEDRMGWDGFGDCAAGLVLRGSRLAGCLSVCLSVYLLMIR